MELCIRPPQEFHMSYQMHLSNNEHRPLAKQIRSFQTVALTARFILKVRFILLLLRCLAHFLLQIKRKAHKQVMRMKMFDIRISHHLKSLCVASHELRVLEWV